MKFLAALTVAIVLAASLALRCQNKASQFSGDVTPTPAPAAADSDLPPVMPVQILGAGLVGWECGSVESASTRENGQAEIGCTVNDAAGKPVPGRADVDEITVKHKDGSRVKLMAQDGLRNVCKDNVCSALFSRTLSEISTIERFEPKFNATVAALNSRSFSFVASNEFATAARRADHQWVRWGTSKTALSGVGCSGSTVFIEGDCAELDDVAPELFQNPNTTVACSSQNPIKVSSSDCIAMKSSLTLVPVSGSCAPWSAGSMAEITTESGCIKLGKR